MTKIFSVLAIAFLIVGMFSVMVAAEEVEEVEVVSPGMGVGALSGLEHGWDKMRLAFTFNKEKKIQRSIDFAEERLAEIEKALEENQSSERLLKAQERHEEFLEKAEELLADIEANGDNETAELALRKLTRIQNKFEKHREKIDHVHERILERHRNRNASEEKLAQLEDVFGKIHNRSLKVEEKALQRRENVKTRYKVIRNMTDEELAEKLSEIEDAEGLIEARKKRLERAKDRVTRIEETRAKIAEKARERLSNAENLTDEQKARIEAHIERFEKNSELRVEGAEFQVKKAERQLKRAKDLIERMGDSDDDDDDSDYSDDSNSTDESDDDSNSTELNESQ